MAKSRILLGEIKLVGEPVACSGYRYCGRCPVQGIIYGILNGGSD